MLVYAKLCKKVIETLTYFPLLIIFTFISYDFDLYNITFHDIIIPKTLTHGRGVVKLPN